MWVTSRMRALTLQRGFTFVELVVTLAIVGVLATAALPLAEVAYQRSKENDLRHALRSMRDAIDAYKKATDEGRIAKAPGASGYPPTLETLAEGAAVTKDVTVSKLYFLRRVPRDPFNDEAGLGAADTWGKRSSDSPPDNPRPGKDVYDVYSQSERKGLNGVPYREW